MINLHKRWLTQKGIAIPPKLKKIELSPLFAVEKDDIPQSLIIPDKEEVYIE